MADPDLHTKGGGRSFRPSDKEGRSPKNFFPPFGPNFGLKISALCMVILISESGTDFCLWNSQSWALENITSNADPTNDCNPKYKFRCQRNLNPRLGIQNPRLSWIPLHGSRQANKPERDISTSMSSVEKIHLVLIFAFIFSTVTCSFQPKTQTMIVVPIAAPKDTPEDGGLTSVLWQILMDCIIMVLIAANIRVEQNGPRLGDNFIP